MCEVLRHREQPELQEWERWKALAAAASLSSLLEQSEEQRAVEQLLGEAVVMSSQPKHSWMPQVLDALAAYKVHSSRLIVPAYGNC